MKLINAFLRLVRLPNLVMIAITQALFYLTLVSPFYAAHPDFINRFQNRYFLLLMASSLLIAAAGNIINDYFDRNIDEINKPDKKIIDKLIKRRWAIVMHIAFSLLAILTGFYIDAQTPVFWLGFSNAICVMLLFAYSISLKKKLLAGNVLISLLTAWVILVCFLCYYRSLNCPTCDTFEWQAQLRRLIRISFLYAGFAFVISLVREVVKDMEDREGDKKYGCYTIPIAWGIPAAKVFVAVWLVVLIGMISILQIYVWHLGWYWSVAYSFLLLIVPLIWILQKLRQANVPKDYHQLSTAVKLVMLAGLFSMIFFKIYS
jgi:4-hydroxybenzoate polyprenyltransferase